MTGKGVRIAILDTGIDPTHPDLDDHDFRRWSAAPQPAQDRRRAELQRRRSCPPDGVDGHGHGTHVAGIAAGTGEGTPLADDNGQVSPASRPTRELAVGKVLTDAGAGVNSDLIAAMEWAAMPADSVCRRGCCGRRRASST